MNESIIGSFYIQLIMSRRPCKGRIFIECFVIGVYSTPYRVELPEKKELGTAIRLVVNEDLFFHFKLNRITKCTSE